MACGALYSSCPLTSLKDHIRILRLAPAPTLEAQLHGELEVRSFSRLPAYEALSYTWQPPFEGQTLPDSVIWFFGYPLPITGNLSNGLRRLRRKDKERVLWVDAVCIDQDDAREPNHQAHLMAKIYSKAIQVLAWLGEDSSLRDGTYTLASLAASDADTILLLNIRESLQHGKVDKNLRAVCFTKSLKFLRRDHVFPTFSQKILATESGKSKPYHFDDLLLQTVYLRREGTSG